MSQSIIIAYVPNFLLIVLNLKHNHFIHKTSDHLIQFILLEDFLSPFPAHKNKSLKGNFKNSSTEKFLVLWKMPSRIYAHPPENCIIHFEHKSLNVR